MKAIRLEVAVSPDYGAPDAKIYEITVDEFGEPQIRNVRVDGHAGAFPIVRERIGFPPNSMSIELKVTT